MITYQINDHGLSRKLAFCIEQVKRPALVILHPVGRELANQLKTHFRTKDQSEANRLGGRRTHFFLQVGRSVQNPVMHGPGAVVVSINHPAFAQKVFGGDIVAKRHQVSKRSKNPLNLTIPISQDAYGRSVSVFVKATGLRLFMITSKRGNELLASATKDGKLTIHYLLKPSVYQQPDPTALPAMEAMIPRLMARAESALKHILEQAKN